MLRTIVFFDGQNLFHGAKDAWAAPVEPRGSPYIFPSYDVQKLAQRLVDRIPDRALEQIRFYTGVPSKEANPLWHGFWSNKLRYLGSKGVYVYKGRISPHGNEKGVDVSLAIDVVGLTYEQAYDTAIIVSQDWDFGPAINLAKTLVRKQGRNVAFESAFPNGPGSKNNRGIPGTQWVRIDKGVYDSCIDPTEYRVL